MCSTPLGLKRRGLLGRELLGVVRMLAGSDRTSSGLTMTMTCQTSRNAAAVIAASVTEAVPTARQPRTYCRTAVCLAESLYDQCILFTMILPMVCASAVRHQNFRGDSCHKISFFKKYSNSLLYDSQTDL